MYIYNVTFKVDNTIAEDWLKWMKEDHIPEVMETRCFSSYKMVQILDIDETEGPTYAVQYHADNREDYNKYLAEYAAALREKTINKWGERFIAFRTLMKIV